MSLSRSDRHRLERRLRRFAQSIGGEINRLNADAEDLSSSREDGDFGDDANQAHGEGLVMMQLDRQVNTMKEVLDALERLESGTYGDCEICGRKIPRERLRAIPYARYCVKCAARHTLSPTSSESVEWYRLLG